MKELKLNNFYKKTDRLKLVIKKVLILLVGVFCFYRFYHLGFGIPCIFYKITGLKCPSCGVTRMCFSILKGDFNAAYNYNRLIFILIPLIVVYFGYKVYQFITKGDTTPNKIEKILLILMMIILVIYAFIRNIMGI